MEKAEESVFHTCHLMSPLVSGALVVVVEVVAAVVGGLLVQVWAVNLLHKPDRSHQRTIIIRGFLRDQEGLPLRHHFQWLLVTNMFP